MEGENGDLCAAVERSVLKKVTRNIFMQVLLTFCYMEMKLSELPYLYL